MNEYMSDWEVKKLTDNKIMHAIREAEQDHLAQQSSIRPGNAGRGRWMLVLLVATILVALLMHLAA